MDGQIVIEYGVVANARANHGWLPQLWVNGKQRLDSWAAKGFGKTEALDAAREAAAEERARYIGDWTITVQERSD